METDKSCQHLLVNIRVVTMLSENIADIDSDISVQIYHR